MKTWKIALGAILAIASFCASAAFELPDKPRFVNDFAQQMTLAEREKIGAALAQFQQQHGVSIVVVTVPSLEGYATSFEMALAIFDKWKIGDAKHNSGILVLIAGRSHPYTVRVMPGRGMEGSFVDLQSKEATRAVTSMLDSRQPYAQAMVVGLRIIMKATGGEFGGLEEQTSDTTYLWLGVSFVLCVLLAILIGTFYSQKRRRREEQAEEAQQERDRQTHSSLKGSPMQRIYPGSQASRPSELPTHSFRSTSADEDDDSTPSSVSVPESSFHEEPAPKEIDVAVGGETAGAGAEDQTASVAEEATNDQGSDDDK
jgi:uncharacterized membrane protein YgcG